MKKIVLYILILFSFNFVKAQNELSENEKIFATAKVWGFLKYYHPEVSKGKFDWDKQLIDKFPQILQTNSKEEFNQIIMNWVNSLGKVKNKNKTEENYEGLNKNFDLSWINNPKIFTSESSAVLKNIQLNRNVGTKYYIDQQPNIGNVKVKNENNYSEDLLSSYQYRLLGLIRYWNIIEYFFPYKYVIGKDWNKVLLEYIPKFKNADNIKDYNLFLLELITEINDTHAKFYSKYTNQYFGYYWFPFQYEVIDKNVVVTGFFNDSLAKINNIKIGDVIDKVDGNDAIKIINSKLKYIPASNNSVKYRDSYVSLNDSINTANLTFTRNGVLINKKVRRYEFTKFKYKWENPYPKWKKFSENIGYINLTDLEENEIPNIMEKLSTTNTIILGLRNGAWDIFGGIGKYIKPKRSPFVSILKPDLSYPGKYKFSETINCCKEIKKTYKGRIIVLVNENTQSHAEYTGMVFQSAQNVMTIGSQTAGADGDVSEIPLVGGYETKMSGVGIFYPDGTETQRKGLKIDIVVKPTIEGIRSGNDEILEKAIEIAND